MAIGENSFRGEPDETTTAIVPVEGTQITWVPSPDTGGVLQEDGTITQIRLEVGYDKEGNVAEIRPNGDPTANKINDFFTQTSQQT